MQLNPVGDAFKGVGRQGHGWGKGIIAVSGSIQPPGKQAELWDRVWSIGYEEEFTSVELGSRSLGEL